MRRGLSILLILLFWLGPIAAALQPGSESRLPACCRRSGKHHCAMSEETPVFGMQSGSGPAFTAPAHCPFYPRNVALSTEPPTALTASAVRLPIPLEQRRAVRSACAEVRLSPILSHEGRGPPASHLQFTVL